MANKIFFNLSIALSFVLFVSNTTNAQLCSDFHKSSSCASKASNEGFQPYGQSKSGMIEINKTFQYKIVLYGDRDHVFALCTEAGYYPIHYRIINAQTKEVIYDNESDEYIESVGFTNDYTQTVILEITVLAKSIDPKDAYDTRACVGINILWRKVPKIGF